jgi:hypothetical protein
MRTLRNQSAESGANDRGEQRPSALREAMQRDEARVASRMNGQYMPFRFWQQKDDECEIVILDNSMEDAFWRQEHNLQIAGKWGNYERCIAESGPCPHCDAGNRSSLVVLMSVLVLRPYKNKKTGKVSNYTKMLLPLKRQQYAEFDRIEAIAMRKYGTFRGTCLIMKRENEENAFSTGMPVNNDDGNIINDWLDEKALQKEFGHDAIKKDGKVLKKADEDIEPFDYRKLFPKQDDEEIREQHGIATPGSRRANRHDQEEEVSERPSRRSRRADDDEDDELPGVATRGKVEDEEEEEVVASPRSRRASRSVEPAEENDEEEDEEEESPRQSRSSRQSPSTGRASSPRRGYASRRGEPSFED